MDPLPLLRVTWYLVEANHNEEFYLWTHWRGRMQWEQIQEGCSVMVGQIDGRPVCLSLTWVKIDGFLVAFYDGVSEVVDHRQIESWLRDHCTPRIKTDATNFHIVVHDINRMVAQQVKAPQASVS